VKPVFIGRGREENRIGERSKRASSWVSLKRVFRGEGRGGGAFWVGTTERQNFVSKRGEGKGFKQGVGRERRGREKKGEVWGGVLGGNRGGRFGM